MEYIEIGRTQKTHGVQGELKIFIEDKFWDDFEHNKRVFLDIRGIKMPYFIKNMRGKGAPIVHFEDVPNREAALLLQSRSIFLREQDLIPDVDRSVYDEVLEYGFLEGFRMIDAVAGDIGVIQEVIEMPQQEMALIQYDGREVLIPLNQHFITNIDETGKTVNVNLPEGLLGL
jgi:16S rRNA processing protein RimM